MVVVVHGVIEMGVRGVVVVDVRYQCGVVLDVASLSLRVVEVAWSVMWSSSRKDRG